MINTYWCHTCDIMFLTPNEAIQCINCNNSDITVMDNSTDVYVQISVELYFITFDESIQINEAVRESLDSAPIIKKVCQKYINTLEETDLRDKEYKHILNENRMCVICQDFLNGVIIRLPCEHMYHKDCILSWFHNKNTCPECRYEFPEHT